MRKTKTNFKKLLNLSLALAISLSVIGFMGGGASAATQTVNLPRNQVVDTTSYYAGTTSGPTWGNIFGSGVVVHHPGSSDDDLSATYNGANFYSRGWNFNAGLICEGASLSTLSITNNLKRPGTFAAAGERDFTTSLALAGQSSLPVISRTHGIDMATFALPSHANITSIGDTADNNSLAQSGGANVTIVYNVSGLTKSQLSQLALTYIIDPESSTASSPTATLTYDNSSCPPLATDPDTSSTTAGTPVSINLLGNDTGSGISVSKIDGQTISSGQTITLSNGSGTVILNPDNTITFTPNSTFSGESIFSYSITDGASTVDTGVVRITVAAATTNTNTTTTTTIPSTPTTSSTSTNSTKVLAKTGEDVRLLAGGGMLVLAAAIYIANLRVKLGKY